ncbi:MAG: MCE family protein, partial [Saprospiraceae bacterium]|nr:MCE family protein [Saprospiraceae bacterium]
EGDLLTSFETIETDDILASIDITTANTEVITEQLAEILIKINSGKGTTLGRLLHD